MNKNILGIDVGGTKIYGARYNVENFEEQLVLRVPTNSSEGFTKVYPNLLRIIRELITPDTVAIGIGVPGPVTPEGTIIRMPNIPQSSRVTLQKDIEMEFKIPVTVANDAVCFLMGEHYFGAGRGYNNILGLTLGTGVGGAILLDGKPYSGKNGVASEFGHMIICKDGKYKTAEELISGTAINRRCHELVANWTGSTSLSALSKGKDIFDAAQKQDPLALELYHQVGKDLGITISNLILSFNPEAIIIGGSVKTAFSYLESSMWETINNHVNFEEARSLDIKVRTAEKPGSHGVAWMARENLNEI